MAAIPSDQPLVPSVLDRLLDDDPGVTRETPKSRHQVLREMKQGLRRDLEDLLNTRRRALPWPAHLAELAVSLVSYGVPDITGADLGSPAGREQYRRTVEEVLRRFEPRFKSVRVRLLDQGDPVDRTLRFRIDALVHAQPAPEEVVFDSALEAATGHVEVKGAAR